jgi:hypothetical protein
MYGMVHEALGQFVRDRADAEAWERVCERAGSTMTIFPSLSTYPDELTVGLVAESANALGLTANDLLGQFGRYWIDYALGTAYGPLLRSSGDTLRETLGSLDAMHARIGTALPQLRPPSFSVEASGDDMKLHYISTRTGLAPFVVGLVEGLAAMHGIAVEIAQMEAKGSTADHDTFLVRELPG